MSLVTDKFFAAALTQSTSVTTAVGGRIFNTVEDEINPDDVPLPYIMIMNDGTVNEAETKDDEFEGPTDTDTIRLTICADTRAALGSLAELVRSVIQTAAQEQDAASTAALGFEVIDYSFSASPVSFDDLKPCYWQDLTYRCETIYD